MRKWYHHVLSLGWPYFPRGKWDTPICSPELAPPRHKAIQSLEPCHSPLPSPCKAVAGHLNPAHLHKVVGRSLEPCRISACWKVSFPRPSPTSPLHRAGISTRFPFLHIASCSFAKVGICPDCSCQLIKLPSGWGLELQQAWGGVVGREGRYCVFLRFKSGNPSGRRHRFLSDGSLKLSFQLGKGWSLCYNHLNIFPCLNQDLSKKDPSLYFGHLQSSNTSPWPQLPYKAVSLDKALAFTVAKGKPLERQYLPSEIGADSLELHAGLNNSRNLRTLHESTALVVSSSWIYFFNNCY